METANRQSHKNEKTYIAIDLKSFYASAECADRHLDPLTTNLVVADPTRTEKTICLAVSPSLKAYGIGGRARLFEVVQKVDEINAIRLQAYRDFLREQQSATNLCNPFENPSCCNFPGMQQKSKDCHNPLGKSQNDNIVSSHGQEQCSTDHNGLLSRQHPDRNRDKSIQPYRQNANDYRSADFTGESFDATALAGDPSLKLSYITAPPRMRRYEEVSAQIYSIYLKYISADDIIVYSIDEIFADVTDYLSYYHMSAHELAMTMIREVLYTTGITATVGIGSNLYLAKVAMDIVAKHVPADADGVRIAELTEESYREKLWLHQPLTDFWRIGKGYRRKLEANGMFTMGDVARCSIGHDPRTGEPSNYYTEDFLFKLFGVNAETLIDHAWGYELCEIKDVKNYKSENKSLSTGQVLKEPYNYEKTKLIVKEMTDLLVLDLVDKGLVTNQMVLTIGYDRSSLVPASSANDAFNHELTLKKSADSNQSQHLPHSNAVRSVQTSTISRTNAVRSDQANTASRTNAVRSDQANTASRTNAVRSDQASTASRTNVVRFNQANTASRTNAVRSDQASTALHTNTTGSNHIQSTLRSDSTHNIRAPYYYASTGQPYTGEVVHDHYGRLIPKHAHGTENLLQYTEDTGGYTSSTQIIMSAVLNLFDRIMDPDLFSRRINVVACHVKPWEIIEQNSRTVCEQLDLFTDYAALEKKREEEAKRREKEHNLQLALLKVKKRYGKNAMLKGMNLEEGATTIERNGQIGGHRSE